MQYYGWWQDHLCGGLAIFYQLADNKINTYWGVGSVKTINVVGLRYEGREEKLRRIINSFKENGTLESWRGHTNQEILEEYIEPFEFEGQRLLNAVDLVKEPNNPHDPDAIKVMMFDAHGKRHHIGYVPKDKTEAIHKDFKIIKQVDVEVYGGKQKIIETDDFGNDVIDFYDTPYGLTIFITDLVDKANNNKLLMRPSEMKPWHRVVRKISLGVIGISILIIILIMLIT